MEYTQKQQNINGFVSFVHVCNVYVPTVSKRRRINGFVDKKKVRKRIKESNRLTMSPSLSVLCGV